MTPTLHIDATGMCCAVGNSTDSASAAMRAGLDHFKNTDFCDFTDKAIVGAMVDGLPLGDIARRVALLFDVAVQECLGGIPETAWAQIPLLLLTAESERPGMPDTWSQEVFAACTKEYAFHAASRICPWGKAGLGLALPYARQLLTDGTAQNVLVAGVDTYWHFAVLTHLLHERRLITAYNSDGFHPGEGAGAVLLSLGTEGQGGLHVSGVGFGEEAAHRLQNELPNRAEGMVAAMRMAVAECGHKIVETHFHYSDCSGEAFYFKETAHALVRCFEHTIPEYPHLVTGSTLGESGAAVGPLLLAHCTRLLCREDGIGNRALLHFSSDDGKRAAVIVEYR